MKTPLSEIVGRLHVLSDLSNDENTALDKISSKGGVVDIGSDEAHQGFLEPRPVSAALDAFLHALPTGVVTALVGIMYAGRDGEKDVLDYTGHLRQSTFRSKEEMVEAISEKLPRMSYIRAGIDLLPGKNIDTFYGQVLAKFGKPGQREKGENRFDR